MSLQRRYAAKLSTLLMLVVLLITLSLPSTHSFSSNPRLFKPPGLSKTIYRSPSINLPTKPFLVRPATQDEDNNEPLDQLVAETSLRLKRVSWLSWWCQVILTVISSVILIFAKNVVAGGGGVQVNFFLAGTGILVSFMSIFWTWGGGARLSRRLLRRSTSKAKAAKMLRKAIDVGVSLNLVGMLLTLLGAEQTVGVLAIKVLTARPWNNPSSPFMAGFDASLQPLDILVVQANTNSLFSHFCSLVCLLYLTRYVKKLDPPSSDGK